MNDAVSARDASPKSSLRDRNRERTRTAILEALVELEFYFGGATNPDFFTYARIAELAGVSERTVYRLFPTRGDIDRAYHKERVLLAGLPEASSIAEYPELMRAITLHWSNHFGNRRVQAESFEDWPDWPDWPDSLEARRQRDRTTLGEVERLLPKGLPTRQRVAVAAVLHSLCSIRSMAIFAARWGLTIEEAGEAQAWALETMLAGLRTTEVEPWKLKQ